MQRRASREPLDKGGWSALLTSFSSFDFVDPALHSLVRGNGAGLAGLADHPAPGGAARRLVRRADH